MWQKQEHGRLKGSHEARDEAGDVASFPTAFSSEEEFKSKVCLSPTFLLEGGSCTPSVWYRGFKGWCLRISSEIPSSFGTSVDDCYLSLLLKIRKILCSHGCSEDGFCPLKRRICCPVMGGQCHRSKIGITVAHSCCYSLLIWAATLLGKSM